MSWINNIKPEGLSLLFVACGGAILCGGGDIPEISSICHWGKQQYYVIERWRLPPSDDPFKLQELIYDVWLWAFNILLEKTSFSR